MTKYKCSLHPRAGETDHLVQQRIQNYAGNKALYGDAVLEGTIRCKAHARAFLKKYPEADQTSVWFRGSTKGRGDDK